MSSSRKGFTLIELIIVMVIIGILASVATPMLRGNVDKAKKTEAIAAMGAIRTAERLYFAEHGQYTNVLPASFVSGAHNLNSYIKAGDLTGTFFNEPCFNVVASGAANGTFNIVCNPAASTTTRKSEVSTMTPNIVMFDNGSITGY